MNELVQKISNYNIFNYLFPGIIVCYFMERFGIYTFFHKDFFVNAFVCYFVGLCLSRISSLVVSPLLRKTRFFTSEPYSDYIEASRIDSKIEVLLEASNSYRTLIVAFGIFPIAFIIKFWGQVWHSQEWTVCLVFISLSLLFVFSYQKQNDFINKRVKNAIKKNKEQKNVNS